MAIELGQHGITVNHIGPGWVKSALNDRSPGLADREDEAATLALIPIPRPSEPDRAGPRRRVPLLAGRRLRHRASSSAWTAASSSGSTDGHAHRHRRPGSTGDAIGAARGARRSTRRRGRHRRARRPAPSSSSRRATGRRPSRARARRSWRPQAARPRAAPAGSSSCRRRAASAPVHGASLLGDRRRVPEHDRAGRGGRARARRASTVNVVAPRLRGRRAASWTACPVGPRAGGRDVAAASPSWPRARRLTSTARSLPVDGGFSITKSAGGSPLLR